MKVGSEYYWYLNDHLGTPQKITTTSGAVVWSAKYSSFGKATVDPSSTVVNPLRLPGQYEDAETRLHYNFYRYYNSDHGRYLTLDPIGIEGGLNLYNYCLSDPIGIFDEYGLSAKKFGACVAACYLGVRTAELLTLFNEDKLPKDIRKKYQREIRKTYKKELRLLSKKQQRVFIRNVVNRKARKKARNFIIKKVGKKVATKLAPNVIPGVGNIASAILTLGDVIKVGHCASLCARNKYCP